METSLHSFLISIPIAIVLWALMLLAVAVVVVLMSQPGRSAAPADARSRPGRSNLGRSRPDRPAADSTAVARPAAALTGGGRLSLGLLRAGRARVSAALGTRFAPMAAGGTPADPMTADPMAADLPAADPMAADLPAGDPMAADPADGGSKADDLRFADEVTVAAERAAITAARCRAGWEAAERELDTAWEAYQEADEAARRTWAATSFPLMSRRRKLGENADRERWLHHAASAACRRRELSIAQLNDVYAHRGWNPRLHPVVQESLLRNAIRENMFAAYQAARRRERDAWQQAEIAAEAVRALRAEAAAAFGRSAAEQPVVSEFWWAEPWTTSELPVAA